jgi:hypothetical protein
MKMGIKIMAGNLASSSGKIRHDPAATAAVVVRLAQEGRRRRTVAQALSPPSSAQKRNAVRSGHI